MKRIVLDDGGVVTDCTEEAREFVKILCDDPELCAAYADFCAAEFPSPMAELAPYIRVVQGGDE